MVLPDRYGTFLLFAVLLTVAPGPDFAVVVKNVLGGGRAAGLAASVGIVGSNLCHGTLTAFGLSAVVLRSQTLFAVVRWAGVTYLVYLGLQALHAAWRGQYAADVAGAPTSHTRRRGLRQGFLSNITNPKVLAFYVSVLPQFLAPDGAVLQGLALAYTHAALSLVWLFVLVLGLMHVGRWFRRRPVRRVLDAVTGTALVGFGLVLATEES